MAPESHGEIDICLVILNHVGIQTREEQDVVDKTQQGVRTRLNLLDEESLVSSIVLCLKQVGKAYDIIQRSTNLIAHIGQERLLEQFGFLSLLGLNSQTTLSLHHIGQVATDSEIMLHLTFLVEDGHHVEHEPNLSTLLIADFRLDGFLDVVSGEVVHAVQCTGNSATETGRAQADAAQL